MSFPSPPVPDQEYTHSNGITYIFSDAKKAWEIKYEQATNTASLPLINPTSRYLPSAGASLPDSGGLLTQSDYNQWAFNSLVKVDETSRVDAGETAPGDADTNQLWYKPSTGSLYVYYNDGSSSQWVEIGGGSDPSNTYTIETDPLSGFAQIKLVDQDGNSSDVHFTATGDLTVSSTATKIEYGVDLSSYATIAKSEADDADLQNQINDLQVVKGAVATFDCAAVALPYNARVGECMFSDVTASLVIVLGFGTENKDGILTKSMQDGDIIEVIAPGGEQSRYTIADATSAPQMVAVTYVSGEQTFAIGTEYSVYIYPQNEEGVSQDYVDAQDQAQDAVTVKLNTANNVTTNDFRLKAPNGNIVFSTSNGSQVGIYHVRDASEDHHAISRGYADARYTTPAYVDNYLPLAGGEMSGVIDLKGDARIKGRDTNDDVKLTIYPSGLIESSSGIRSDVASSGANCFEARNNGSTNLYVQGSGKAVSSYVVTSSDIDGTLATKKYVDDNAGGNVNLDNYVEKTGSVMTGQLTINRSSSSNAIRIQQSGTNLFRVYPANGEGRVEVYSGQVFKLLATVNGTNTQIAKIYDDGEIRIFHHKDPVTDKDVVNKQWSLHNGMRWTHADHTDAGSLVAGEFFIASNGNIYMHGTSKDGINIAPGNTATEEDGLKFFCSVHRSNGESAYFITTNKVAFNQGSNNYIRIEKLHAHLGDSTVSGETYRLNIPGFTY